MMNRRDCLKAFAALIAVARLPVQTPAQAPVVTHVYRDGGNLVCFDKKRVFKNYTFTYKPPPKYIGCRTSADGTVIEYTGDTLTELVQSWKETL
jgi:hypothetical protein